MASPDTFLIANIGCDLKDEVMPNVTFGLMDKALELFIVPGLCTLGADVHDGSMLLHRIFELRGLYHKVQDVLQVNGTIESSVYKTIYEVTHAIQGHHLAEKMALETADNANPTGNPSVLLPAAKISVSKESLKTTCHSNCVKSAKIIVDSDEGEIPKAEMSLIDLLDTEACIDCSHIFIKAQKVIAKAEKHSKASSSKKIKLSRDVELPLGEDLTTSHANMQMIQSCIGQTEFEVAYLT
ncbi:hypothetical protein CPB84DRAFT_1848501 [Gymnopilus junonius]|uniref:Uncharacterized protein n=1 Tax=Gymnopilus junonius TaxID=109634 RepID=A0A9P5NI70_GYMJU|nr:hypothetical protein CPB84DRAFT_1848501 [Gymnopilus junonius]